MLKAYLISPDDKGWGKTNNYLINAIHECGLPGIACSVCKRTWTGTGLIYPSIECSLLLDLRPAMKPLPAPLQEFAELVEKVKARLGSYETVLGPGADFGPLNGTAMGKFGDFAWVNSWTPLVRASVYKQFKERGLNLIGVEANLRFRKKDMEPLIELEAHPNVRLHKNCLPERTENCPICGWEGLNAPDKIVIQKSYFKENIPIQRIAELPTYLAVNEEMSSIIQEMNLRDVTLDEIDVI